MKRLVYIICMLLAAVAASAQNRYEKLQQDMQDNVAIHESSAITSLINDKVNGTSGEMKQITGYRVQIYSSNSQQTAKAEALRLEKRVLEENLEVEVHVLYTPPFWKVRLGDFRTKAEADLMKAEVIRRMPELQGDTYVVRDQITVKK